MTETQLYLWLNESKGILPYLSEKLRATLPSGMAGFSCSKIASEIYFSHLLVLLPSGWCHAEAGSLFVVVRWPPEVQSIYLSSLACQQDLGFFFKLLFLSSSKPDFKIEYHWTDLN